MAESPRGRRRRGALLVLLPVLLLSACIRSSNGEPPETIVVTPNDDGYHGAVLTQPYTVPETPLEDTDGKAYSLAQGPDTPVTLVFFGYTHCPDICQLVMSTVASSLRQVEPEVAEQVSVAFVTTDPARDDAATLRDYLDRFDPGYVGLTGDLAEIEAVGEDLGVFIARGAELPDGGYEIDHSTPVVGVTDDGTAPIVWTQGTSAGDLADDVTRLVAEQTR